MQNAAAVRLDMLAAIVRPKLSGTNQLGGGTNVESQQGDQESGCGWLRLRTGDGIHCLFLLGFVELGNHRCRPPFQIALLRPNDSAVRFHNDYGGVAIHIVFL